MKPALATRVVLIIGLCLVSAEVSADGQQLASRSAAPTVAASGPADDSAGSGFVIGADDVLSVVFWRDQTLSGDVLVRPDGMIPIPLLDDIQAAGLTPKQLRDKLIAEARRFVAEPVATVVVKQINSRKVYITGLVARPGQYALATSMTVVQLIATAGGLLDFAKTKEIGIMRVENGQVLRLRFDYDEMTKNPEKASPHLVLKPGDTVIVP